MIFLLHGPRCGRRGPTLGYGASYAGETACGGVHFRGRNGWRFCLCTISTCCSSWWCCGGCGAAAAPPGVDPHSFGHGRAADETTTRVEADALCGIFNPTGFVKERAVSEVGRLAGALVGPFLPFGSCNIAPALTALDRAVVFNAPVALTPAIDLAAADLTQGNGGFAMFGDVCDCW